MNINGKINFGSLILISIIVLISSCSISKRQHSKGFYLELNQTSSKFYHVKKSEIKKILSKQNEQKIGDYLMHNFFSHKASYTNITKQINLNKNQIVKPKENLLKLQIQKQKDLKKTNLKHEKQRNSQQKNSNIKKDPRPISNKASYALFFTLIIPPIIGFVSFFVGLFAISAAIGAVGIDSLLIGSISFSIGLFLSTLYGIYLTFKAKKEIGKDKPKKGSFLIYLSFMIAAFYIYISIGLILSEYI